MASRKRWTGRETVWGTGLFSALLMPSYGEAPQDERETDDRDHDYEIDCDEDVEHPGLLPV